MLIVKVWEVIILGLSRISLFDLLMRYVISRLKWTEHKKFMFVDIWVMGHTLLSLVAVIVSRYSNNELLKDILLYYGILRVFEIFVYQTKVILVDGYQVRPNVRSYRRTVICLLHNFIEIIFWFTFSYLVLIQWFDVAERKGSLVQAFYMSFVTMTTFGPPNFNIDNSKAMGIIMAQSLVGLLITLISLARFVGLLPKPATLDKNEREIEKSSSE
jgi:hypothetical protein